MKKVIVDLNLRGIDTKGYEKNPVVTREFNQTPIGRAKILKGKKQVEIELIQPLAISHKDFSIGYIQEENRKILTDITSLIKVDIRNGLI